MATLNRTEMPERREQESPNARVSSYAATQLPTQIGNDFVAKSTTSGWGSPTGTADRAAFATYTAPTISNPPTQAEVQAVADAMQVLSRHLKALIDDLKAKGVI